MKWLLLPILLFNSKTVQAIDSGCTTTSNLSIYRCPEGSVDWYDGYTDLVDTLDALGDGLTSAGALKSSPTITGFNTGSVLFIGGSSKVNQNNGKFYWDDTNTRLGILTSSPTYPLHVEGAGNFLGQGVFGGSVTVKSDGMDVTGNARFRANIAADGDTPDLPTVYHDTGQYFAAAHALYKIGKIHEGDNMLRKYFEIVKLLRTQVTKQSQELTAWRWEMAPD